jgi:LAO/AO transport system kinase
VVLNAPGLGDDIQAMKSGVLEIADIVVVNKADLPGAEATLRQLQFALSLGQGRKETPILKTVATSGEGVAELAAEIMRVSSLRNPDPQERRRRRARRLLAWAAADLIERQIREQTGPEVDALCDDILAGTTAPAAAARKLLAKEKR